MRLVRLLWLEQHTLGMPVDHIRILTRIKVDVIIDWLTGKRDAATLGRGMHRQLVTDDEQIWS